MNEQRGAKKRMKLRNNLPLSFSFLFPLPLSPVLFSFLPPSLRSFARFDGTIIIWYLGSKNDKSSACSDQLSCKNRFNAFFCQPQTHKRTKPPAKSITRKCDMRKLLIQETSGKGLCPSSFPRPFAPEKIFKNKNFIAQICLCETIR